MEIQEKNDFEIVETIIEKGLEMTDKLRNLDLEKMNNNARLFLISQLKTISGIIISIIIRYDKN